MLKSTRKSQLSVQMSKLRQRIQGLCSRSQRIPLQDQYDVLNAEFLALHDEECALRQAIADECSFKPQSSVAASALAHGIMDRLHRRKRRPYGGPVTNEAYNAGYDQVGSRIW